MGKYWVFISLVISKSPPTISGTAKELHICKIFGEIVHEGQQTRKGGQKTQTQTENNNKTQNRSYNL